MKRGAWLLFLGALAAPWTTGCSGCTDADSTPPLQVVRIERDLLAEPGAWQTLRARAEAPARVEVLCPAFSAEVDGADMPALVLAPPGEVRLEIAAESTPARLVTRVGVDQLAFGALSEELPALRVAFEARSGERLLARAELELVRGQHAHNAWVDLGGKEGLALDGPQTLTLRTEVVRGDGGPVDPALVVRAGFGGLRLERRLERARARSSPAQPSVVLIVMDTLRADRLSAYGYARATSPRLAELSARGTLFENCYSSASWTWPATASILTGLTPMEHGLIGEGSSFLLEQAETLAESLQLAGFTTAAWSGNPIVSPARNFDQGFERFTSPPQRFRKSAEFFEDVRAFLRASAGRRFFLYLHLTEPHSPLEPLAEGARLLAAGVPVEFRAKCEGLGHATSRGQAWRADGTLALDEIANEAERAWVGELYDACVWSGDHWLGQVTAELASLGLEDETVVAFSSDHGEELFERGFLGHGQSLRRELVRVPLVLAGPGVPRAQRHAGLASSRMLAPLLASLAGVPFANAEAARRTLAQLDSAEDCVLFSTTKGFWKGRNRMQLLGLTDGEWHLALAPQGAPWGTAEPPSAGDVELYHLRDDPGELVDVAARHPDVVERLRALLLERTNALKARRLGADIPAGGATLRMLEELGYAGH